ncbi:hypothetical protein TBLA_0C05690 [Henningerozyma blattae CBS 6284]|uniref:Replication factor A protein 3 n=1 Tax=Henningerozyma blattae (strain ATCC 34711 / CBS 6284 / DSM 70876 / NBRC 10599 / NRRL Y-10934 / UCD 77-7) TaxID=1071380 RepID=I2H1W5_HENB6|nr:hypothetical protein TBLA_0C05690 [Tetrapisispora blattae CBS 6284]CCH60367.1 hypothetical protein TBLA_0C05690 [Tetrapisispora blattae CBS 6284]
MASETPRIPATQINNQPSVFRIIGKIKSQPNESTLILESPVGELNAIEMITINNVRITTMNQKFQIGKWYEFVCRSSDNGDSGFLVLDALECVLKENEDISVEGIVALQNLYGKFPEIF